MKQATPAVHLIDDDAAFLMATGRLFRATGLTVAQFGSAQEFLASLTPETRGCVIADLRMPGLNGLDMQTALARTKNPLPVIFLTGYGDIPASVRAMRNGAEDFLEKCAPKEQLLEAVKRALSRDAAAQEKRDRVNEFSRRFASLSEREREVLHHVLQGKLNKQIAFDLGIHERTVKLHRTSITRKLRVQSVANLSRIAQEIGLFE
jgi:two-component system, LuxR family, response regulator FixJ